MRRIALFGRLARSLSSSVGGAPLADGAPLAELRAQIKGMREKGAPQRVEVTFVNKVLTAILHEYKAEVAQAAATAMSTEGTVTAEEGKERRGVIDELAALVRLNSNGLALAPQSQKTRELLTNLEMMQAMSSARRLSVYLDLLPVFTVHFSMLPSESRAALLDDLVQQLDPKARAPSHIFSMQLQRLARLRINWPKDMQQRGGESRSRGHRIVDVLIEYIAAYSGGLDQRAAAKTLHALGRMGYCPRDMPLSLRTLRVRELRDRAGGADSDPKRNNFSWSQSQGGYTPAEKAALEALLQRGVSGLNLRDVSESVGGAARIHLKLSPESQEELLKKTRLAFLNYVGEEKGWLQGGSSSSSPGAPSAPATSASSRATRKENATNFALVTWALSVLVSRNNPYLSDTDESFLSSVLGASAVAFPHMHHAHLALFLQGASRLGVQWYTHEALHEVGVASMIRVLPYVTALDLAHSLHGLSRQAPFKGVARAPSSDDAKQLLALVPPALRAAISTAVLRVFGSAEGKPVPFSALDFDAQSVWVGLLAMGWAEAGDAEDKEALARVAAMALTEQQRPQS